MCGIFEEFFSDNNCVYLPDDDCRLCVFISARSKTESNLNVQRSLLEQGVCLFVPLSSEQNLLKGLMRILMFRPEKDKKTP